MILRLHFTKSQNHKHDNIYKLCLWTIEEQASLILTLQLILTSILTSKLRYTAHALRIYPLPTFHKITRA